MAVRVPVSGVGDCCLGVGLMWVRLLLKRCPGPGVCDRTDDHGYDLNLLGRLRFCFWLAVQ